MQFSFSPFFRISFNSFSLVYGRFSAQEACVTEPLEASPLGVSEYVRKEIEIPKLRVKLLVKVVDVRIYMIGFRDACGPNLT